MARGLGFGVGLGIGSIIAAAIKRVVSIFRRALLRKLAIPSPRRRAAR